MRKEINLDIELEIPWLCDRELPWPKIEDPTRLPFKLLLPTCKSSIHHPLLANIQTITLRWIHEIIR